MTKALAAELRQSARDLLHKDLTIHPSSVARLLHRTIYAADTIELLWDEIEQWKARALKAEEAAKKLAGVITDAMLRDTPPEPAPDA